MPILKIYIDYVILKKVLRFFKDWSLLTVMFFFLYTAMQFIFNQKYICQFSLDSYWSIDIMFYVFSFLINWLTEYFRHHTSFICISS